MNNNITQEIKQDTGTGTSFVELKPLDAVTEEFIELALQSAVRKKDSHGNLLNDATNYLNTLQAFLVISKAICANYSENAFSFQDCLTYANQLLGYNRQFEYDILKDLFNGWTDYLKKHNRLKEINGAYDYSIFSFNV